MYRLSANGYAYSKCFRQTNDGCFAILRAKYKGYHYSRVAYRPIRVYYTSLSPTKLYELRVNATRDSKASLKL